MRLTEPREKFGYLHRLDDGIFRLGPKPLFLGSLHRRHFKSAEFLPQALCQMVAELQKIA